MIQLHQFVVNGLKYDKTIRLADEDGFATVFSGILVQSIMFTIWWRVTMITGTVHAMIVITEPARVSGKPTVERTKGDMTPDFPRKWHAPMVFRPVRFAKPHLAAWMKKWNHHSYPHQAAR